MLAIGTVIAVALSFIPYFLIPRATGEPSLAAASVSAPALESVAPKRARGEPVFDAASWYAARGEEPETHGVLIETLDQERVLASHNADQAFNPASLIKLATSLAVLRRFGADFRFQTQVFMDGSVDQTGALQGRLYVTGADPTFGDYGANLIAKELRERGIKRITDAVIVSPDFCFNFSGSAEESAARLLRALRVKSPKTGLATEPAGERLFTLNSNPLRDILLYMNAHSSNFVAERLGELIGGPSGLQQFLINQLGLPMSQVSIETTSGRQHNRMTPRGLLAVIRALVDEAKEQGLEPADIMPIASDDSGTLRRRLAGTGLEGAVVAKTGTLTADIDGGMASLAGIVYTQDAGPIIFSILDQGPRIWENRQLEDQLLAEVINMQSTPRAIASPAPRRMLPSSNLSIDE